MRCLASPLNEPLIHEAVRNFMANRRGRELRRPRRAAMFRARAASLWKQKGTGRARIAQLALAALERRRQCARTAATRLVIQLAEEDAQGRDVLGDFRALREGNVVMVDDGRWRSLRRKSLLLRLGNWDSTGKTLDRRFAEEQEPDACVAQCADAKVVNSYGVNIYDLVNHQKWC